MWVFLIRTSFLRVRAKGDRGSTREIQVEKVLEVKAEIILFKLQEQKLHFGSHAQTPENTSSGPSSPPMARLS